MKELQSDKIIISEKTVIELIERLQDCMQQTEFYYYGVQLDFGDLSVRNSIIHIDNLDEIDKCLLVVVNKYCVDFKEIEWIKQHTSKINILLYVDDCSCLESFNEDIKLKIEDKYLFLLGPIFGNGKLKCPEQFKIMAIMHVYNEDDILEKTINYLLSEGIDLYLIDNWSTDNTGKIIDKYEKLFPDKVFSEKYPKSGANQYYEWYEQLHRTEELSETLEYDWFIHYDCDEMRVAPWKGVSLKEFIYNVDRLGYNCIENTVIDFRLTEKDQENIFMQDTYFDFRYKNGLFDQVKTWKKCTPIDLKTTGGHFARFNNPCLFPLKILNRHYPMRSLEQARKKVFIDRLPRFEKESRKRGWHSHYNHIVQDNDMLYDKQQLFLWNDMTWKNFYLPLFTECGIIKHGNDKYNIELPDDLYNSKVILYGAGKIGQSVSKYYLKNIIAWVDIDWKRLPMINGKKIDCPEELKKYSNYDYILICIQNKSLQEEIKEKLVTMGIEVKKIVCVDVQV